MASIQAMRRLTRIRVRPSDREEYVKTACSTLIGPEGRRGITPRPPYLAFGQTCVTLAISISLLLVFCGPHAYADMPIVPGLLPTAEDTGSLILGCILGTVFIVGIIGWLEIRKKYAGD